MKKGNGYPCELTQLATRAIRHMPSIISTSRNSSATNEAKATGVRSRPRVSRTHAEQRHGAESARYAKGHPKGNR